MRSWIEPQVAISWWNPLAWLLRLCWPGWYVMHTNAHRESFDLGPWCDSFHRSKRDAQRRADELNSGKVTP